MELEEKNCDYCSHWFKYGDEDTFFMPEIIDGQYVEIYSVTCPLCKCANEI